MIKLLKPYQGHEIDEILSIGCVLEKKLIDEGIAFKLKLPKLDYVVKG
jgi:hypothetical protein